MRKEGWSLLRAKGRASWVGPRTGAERQLAPQLQSPAPWHLPWGSAERRQLRPGTQQSLGCGSDEVPGHVRVFL